VGPRSVGRIICSTSKLSMPSVDSPRPSRGTLITERESGSAPAGGSAR
jgi:hypothetical protein